MALFRSAVDNTEIEAPGFVYQHPDDANLQIFHTMIPLLPAGKATVTLIDQVTGARVGPLAVTVEAPPPLTRPAQEIIADLFTRTIAAIDGLNASTPGYNQAKPLFDDARKELVDAQEQLGQ
ncbi:MAG TPA: hypothetical protein PKE45_08610 [Caldilineaceae bacterium]|nr:hypothetical protein [Caldilineaceae bacterium]